MGCYNVHLCLCSHPLMMELRVPTCLKKCPVINLFFIVVSIHFAGSQLGVFTGYLQADMPISHHCSFLPKIARSCAKKLHLGPYGI
jgi:hypothetical protein